MNPDRSEYPHHEDRTSETDAALMVNGSVSPIGPQEFGEEAQRKVADLLASVCGMRPKDAIEEIEGD